MCGNTQDVTEPREAFGVRSGLPALSNHPTRNKAGASSTHSKRFARKIEQLKSLRRWRVGVLAPSLTDYTHAEILFAHDGPARLSSVLHCLHERRFDD